MKINKNRKIKLNKIKNKIKDIIVKMMEALPKKKLTRYPKYNNSFYVKRIIHVLYSGSTWEEVAAGFCDESTKKI